MTKSRLMTHALRHGSVAVAVAMGMASTATIAAQVEEMEVIVVTGSHIEGAAENAALPVDVLRAEDIEKQGAPTVVELLKQLPSSGVVLGDTNQFAALSQGQEGTGSVNLRGLGANRTLVLLNGRRMAMNALSANGAVDTNLIPVSAISRVEVLKDGAAATYGSDAIGGVVNFITRSNFTGLDLGGDYKWVEGSEGDYRANINWGWSSDRIHLLVSAGYQHRSELMSTDRDWALRPFAENPQGGWSGSGNPGSFQRVSGTGAALNAANTPDPQCGVLGSVASATGCTWSYMKFDAIAEEENRYQLFSSLDVDLTDDTTLRFEALYSNSEVPNQPLSPSYSLNNFPTGTQLSANAPAVPFRYVIPCANPGLQDMFAKNPAFAAAIGGDGCLNATGAPAGSYTATTLWRPFAESGNLVQNGDSQIDKRSHEGFRLSAGLNGSLGSAAWDVGVTYMQNTGNRFNYDITVNRLQLALAGFGGPNCTGTTPGANGCLWLNPFSNAIQRNVVTGEVNPQYNAGVSNGAPLNAWLQQPLDFEAETELTVVDAVLNGEMPFALGGDNIGWAVGAQYRDSGYKTSVNDLANTRVTPCIDSTISSSATCLAAQGPFGFLAGYTPIDVDQQVWALFGELNVPIIDTLNAQLAVRYEDYGSGVGSTTNPKLAVRWQVIPQLALRGSVGTTFRGPTPINLDTTGSGTSLQAIGAASFASRAVDSFGNANLDPETADTFNAGIVTEIGNFRATLDYWKFKFEDPITSPPFNGIASNVVPTNGGLANCSAPMRDLVTFDGGNSCVQGVTTGANLLRVRVDTINGAPVTTSGVDLELGYTFDNVFGGTLDLSASGSYVLEYKVGALFYRGIQLVAAYDAVGFLNYDRGQNSLPEVKAAAYANYAYDIHNFNLGVQYVSSYEDNRTALFTTTSPKGRTIDSTMIWDATYQLRLPSQTTVSVSVDNLFDEDPSFARTELSYDAYVGNALGRTFRLGLRKQF